MELAEKHKMDGVMIGRGAIGNPWAFMDLGDSGNGAEVVPPLFRLWVAVELIAEYHSWLGE